MELTPEEQAILKALDRNLEYARRAKLSFLREAHRNRGEIAATLEGLKSESGKPFEVAERFTERRYTHATVPAEFPVQHVTIRYVAETAYLCKAVYQQEDPDSCGWVKGEPQEVPYNNIATLSGSAGYRYYCRICGRQIGERRTVMS